MEKEGVQWPGGPAGLTSAECSATGLPGYVTDSGSNQQLELGGAQGKNSNNSFHLLSAYREPGIILTALHELPLLMLVYHPVSGLLLSPTWGRGTKRFSRELKVSVST